MDKIFTVENDTRGEALLNWAKNLETIGITMQMLSDKELGTEWFDLCGRNIGLIIEDYARAIHNSTEDVANEINEFFREGKHTTLEKAKRMYNLVKDKPYTCPDDLRRIDKNLEMIKPALIDGKTAADLQEALLAQRVICAARLKEKRPSSHVAMG